MTAVYVPASPVAVADRYPANVYPPTGPAFLDARVILTRPTPDGPGELLVYADQRPAPLLAERATWVPEGSIVPHGRRRWSIETDLGRFAVDRGRGCGCRSPLKSWRPWGGYALAALPAEVSRG